MAKQLLIGKADFAALVQSDSLFVDMSARFIPKVLSDPSAAVVITRPRRWGKTLNLSMLHYFLAPEVNGLKTAGLFDALEIARIPGEYVDTYQGKYPVICMSFKDFKARSFDDAIDGPVMKKACLSNTCRASPALQS